MKLEKERRQIQQESSELKRLRDLYNKDIRSYLDDYLSGKIPNDSAGYNMIREIAEEKFRGEIREMFHWKNLVRAWDITEESSLMFLIVPDKASGRATVGSIGIKEFVSNIRYGSNTIEVQTNSGKASLSTCDAIL